MISLTLIKLFDDVLDVYSTPLRGSFVICIIIWRAEEVIEEEAGGGREEEVVVGEEDDEEEGGIAVDEIKRSSAERSILDSVFSLITGNQFCIRALGLAIIEGTTAIW